MNKITNNFSSQGEVFGRKYIIENQYECQRFLLSFEGAKQFYPLEDYNPQLAEHYMIFIWEGELTGISINNSLRGWGASEIYPQLKEEIFDTKRIKKNIEKGNLDESFEYLVDAIDNIPVFEQLGCEGNFFDLNNRQKKYYQKMQVNIIKKILKKEGLIKC